MNEKLIKKLKKGTIAVVNDGTLDELNEVLKCAFPYDYSKCGGTFKYYFKSSFDENFWTCNDETNLTIHPVKEFLTQEKQIMSTVVNINPDTSEINITPKEGFEIDLENSDLKNGKVLFKEVEKIYPNRFVFPKIINVEEVILSKIYAQKLETLDALLCLRDEYNRIDGFEEGFRLGDQNWCILHYKCELKASRYVSVNRIMHFGKKETAKLFLKNFEEQLEQVKEFL